MNKTLIEFAGCRAKTYSNLKDNYDKNKKSKGTKKCVIKRKIIFQESGSEKDNIFTVEVSKIALSSNDEKRMQSINSD